MENSFRQKFINDVLVPGLEDILEKSQTMSTISGNDYFCIAETTLDGKYNSEKDSSAFKVFLFRGNDKRGFFASQENKCNIYGAAFFLYKELKEDIDDNDKDLETKLTHNFHEHCNLYIMPQFE